MSLRHTALAACGTLLATLSLSAAAHADFGIRPGSFSVAAHELTGPSPGAAVTQAGAHPQGFTVDFALNETTHANGGPVPIGNLKDVRVTLPRGFVGDPQATPRCRHSDFQVEACSRLTMVGVEELTYSPFLGQAPTPMTTPVYNLVPPKGTVARFAFKVTVVTVMIDMRVRADGSYVLVSDIGELSQGLQTFRSKLTLFGVPADMSGPGPFPIYGGGTYGGSSGAPRRPFLTLPTTCGEPLRATVQVRSWQQPDRWVGDEHSGSALTGCERLSFRPSLDLRPDSPRAGVPAGYEVRVAVPQSEGADGLGTPLLKDVAVTLPEGVAISPSQAHGLEGCSDAQAALGSEAEPACPAASRIGSLQIDTPVLPEPLTGGVFLGQPKSQDSQTGEMLRILGVAQGSGVTIKLEGRIVPDPRTGQLRVSFRDNPQQPFSLLTMRFQGGSRAPLSNPRTCGSFATSAQLSSYGGQAATSSSTFDVTQDAAGGSCRPLGFAPSFTAGMASAAAGASSAFTVAFGRDDAQQDLGDLRVELPPGLMGMLAAADLCDDAAAAAGTCGAGSRIGNVSVAAGPGTNPFQLSGEGVHVTGPYKGAPFGLSIVVRADAGPYRLGTVVVRAAIHVDRRTAALRIVSDPFPTILQGIPLRMRQVTVAIDKPGFMVNPTSCAQRRIDGTLRSSEGAAASVSSRFQVGGCKALPFRPRLSLRVGSRGRTRTDVTTPFAATLRMTRGQANNRAVTVTLPKSLNARLRVVNDACTLAQFEAGSCTRRVGSAVAVTPVLRDPLRGAAYFVRNPARRLPDLMVALKGQGRAAGVAIDLAGKVTIPRDLSLRTSFDTIPDVPISMFRLSLVAGRNGAIGATANLCAARTRRSAVARVGFRAHSGRATQTRPRLRIAGCAKRKTSK